MAVEGSPEVAIATFGLSSGGQFDPHTHAEHQLTWADSGVLSVEAAGSTWVLPGSLALWMPAGLPHAVIARGPCLMRGVYVNPATCPITWESPTVVAVDGLLRELIRHLAEPGLEPAARARAEAILCDLLRPVEVRTVHVPLPADDRALKVAGFLMADPSDGRSLDELGRSAGASGRTLARLFAAETGLTFGEWRAQVRLRAALELLAAGMPVTTVTGRVGFANPSAFVAMFRRLTGTTPGAYFGSGPA